MKVRVYYRLSADKKREFAYLLYTLKGKRHRQTTGISLPVEPVTQIEKAEREEGLRMLDALRAKTEMQIAEGKTGIKTKFGKKCDVVEYVERGINSDADNVAPRTTIQRKGMLKHLKNAFPKGYDSRYVSIDFVDEYREYLQGLGLNGVTIANYVGLLAKFIHDLQKDEIVPKFEIPINKPKSKKRVFLTTDELNEVEQYYGTLTQQGNRTQFKKQCFRIFLFSCYTGLRVSDLMRLKYSNIESSAEGNFIIVIEQQKTKNDVIIPLIQKAMNLLNVDMIGNDSKVFNFDNHTTIDNCLLRNNPIKKRFTMHTGRHTFAVQLLERGADIYSVSRLLGHTSIKTTEIYADMTTTKANAIVSLLDK